MTEISFYQDWTFWTAITSTVAIILSQLPPVKLWFRPRRLDVEVHSRVQLTHKVGNPNVGMFVSINNNGGRTLQIRSIKVTLSRDGLPLLALPAQNYFETTASQTSILFVPFSLDPGGTWAHPTIFLNLFDRSKEKLYRAAELALKSDIQEKFDARQSEDKKPVIAEPELVAPFMNLFNQLFVWEPGEYVIELTVDTKSKDSLFSEKYRFTLYESDSIVLKAHTGDYKFGGGISYNVDSHAGIYIPISKHVG